MNRRKFLKLLGLTPVVAVLAAKIGTGERQLEAEEELPFTYEVQSVEPSEFSWRTIVLDKHQHAPFSVGDLESYTITDALVAPGNVWISPSTNTWQLVGPEERV